MLGPVVQGLPTLVEVWRTHEGVELEAERRHSQPYQWEGVLSYLTQVSPWGWREKTAWRSTKGKAQRN